MKKGQRHSEEARARISAARRGKKRSPEARARMSAAQQRRYAGAPKNIEVPVWVRRAGLVAEFLQTAARDDEFAAAQHCRALLREMGQ